MTTTPTTATSRSDATALPPGKLFIGGQWVPAASGETFAVINPATEGHLLDVAAAGAADVDRAVTAARRQFDGGVWSALSGADRGRLLIRIAELVERDLDNLAQLEALECGKPLSEAVHGDIPQVIEVFRHFAGWADKIFGATIPVPDFDGRRRLSYTLRPPIGVVGAITPWNAPTMIGAWKIAPALAAGCTVVVKPPEDAPLSTLRLAQLIAEAGVPAGVVNIVPGLGAVAGAALVNHPGVNKVSFTGSPAVGAEIARATGPSFTRTTLELGGKSPQLILPDANLDDVVPTAAASLFINQGETCAAGTRILVHRSREEELLAALADRAASIVVGDPFDPATEMGSLINARQRASVLSYIEAGHHQGAQLVAGGHAVAGPGFFMEPTVFRGTNDMRIARGEIFGPVGTVISYTDIDDAVAMANDTKYGLAAVIWTTDLARAHTIAERLRVGAVWVNAWGPPDPRLPWGGVKTSGIGQELGTAGLLANTTEKVVSLVF